jgi:nitroimidazol reductase NimA-like FMN-containing flavoprotein (pyridoxamine 5'-phosphate oxidase superfamily)
MFLVHQVGKNGMRRKDRKITDPSEIHDILDRADVCRIAFAVDNEPYIVTLNFGYRWTDHLELFFHCAKEGRKLSLMERNNRVCFEMDVDHELKTGDKACEWGMGYRSLVGTGRLTRIDDAEEKLEGLNRIMNHYGSIGKNEYIEDVLGATEVLKLQVTEFSGKKKAVNPA